MRAYTLLFLPREDTVASGRRYLQGVLCLPQWCSYRGATCYVLQEPEVLYKMVPPPHLQSHWWLREQTLWANSPKCDYVIHWTHLQFWRRIFEETCCVLTSHSDICKGSVNYFNTEVKHLISLDQSHWSQWTSSRASGLRGRVNIFGEKWVSVCVWERNCLSWTNNTKVWTQSSKLQGFKC